MEATVIKSNRKTVAIQVNSDLSVTLRVPRQAAIIQLGDGDFQKFCDTFLSQKQYGKIHGLGMKSGTLKTTIGNPDTYVRKENGK